MNANSRQVIRTSLLQLLDSPCAQRSNETRYIDHVLTSRASDLKVIFGDIPREHLIRKIIKMERFEFFSEGILTTMADIRAKHGRLKEREVKSNRTKLASNYAEVF